jgi:hypothetical protein
VRAIIFLGELEFGAVAEGGRGRMSTSTLYRIYKGGMCWDNKLEGCIFLFLFHFCFPFDHLDFISSLCFLMETAGTLNWPSFEEFVSFLLIHYFSFLSFVFFLFSIRFDSMC